MSKVKTVLSFLKECNIEDQVIFDKDDSTWRLSGILIELLKSQKK